MGVIDKEFSRQFLTNNPSIEKDVNGKDIKVFNPVDFDATEWVNTAKSAGAHYIVVTAKHHDGFALFDSKVSDFDILDATPFDRDPLKELVDAAHEAGIKIGFYYVRDTLLYAE